MESVQLAAVMALVIYFIIVTFLLVLVTIMFVYIKERYGNNMFYYVDTRAIIKHSNIKMIFLIVKII